MISQNIEFHNTAELEPVFSGFALQRFPENVRNRLGHREHERGRFYSMVSTCCEIRFVTDAPFFRLSLSASEADTKVLIYRGSFVHSIHRVPAGAVTTLHIETPPHMAAVDNTLLDGHPFASNVWRVVFGKDALGIFCGLNTFGHSVRPPKDSEKPALRWLAYGSSITFGAETNLITNAYPMTASRLLHADVFNKAIAGSCFCDACIAEYFSTLPRWDIATLELGVNMVGRFTETEFAQRTEALAKALLTSNPGKPVVLLSPFPAHYRYAKDRDSMASRNYFLFGDALRKVAQKIGSRDLFFLDGAEILTDTSGLTADLLHPSDDGHTLMGFRLAEKLREVLKKYPAAERS